MARLRKALRRATRAVKKVGQIALPLIFPAIGATRTDDGFPPWLGEEEPTEEEGGPPFPPEEEPEVEEEGF